MATIKRRSDRGDRWQVRYRDDKGEQRGRLFDRKVDAERFAATTSADIARGVYLDPAAARRTFADYAAAWQAAQVHRPTTAAKLSSDLRNHVLPFFGDRPLGSVRPSEIQAWVKGRADVLAPATVEVIYRYLAAIFAAAVDDRLIHTSPCGRKVKLPKREEGTSRCRGCPLPHRRRAGPLPGARRAGSWNGFAAGRSVRRHRRPGRLPAPSASR